MADTGFEAKAVALLRKLQAWVLRNYLPFAFLVAFIIAMCWPLPGRKVLEPTVRDVHIVTFVNICIVFFISGLTLRTDELKAALTRKTIAGTLFGFVSIIGITPLLGFAVRRLNLNPEVFITGMTIFTVVPTTLGVGISLTQSAGANVGLAIFNTVVTNVCGVIFVPLWLKAMLSSSGSAGVEGLNISIADIFVKLLLSNFVPTLLGKVLRDYCKPVQKFVKANRVRLSLISNTNLAMLIWQTLSGARETLIRIEFGTMLLVIAMDLIVHFIYLIFNTAAVFALRLPLMEAIPTIITTSQKSAPVAVTVINYITTNPTDQGLLAVPCVLGQLVQIFVGQPLANYMGGLVKEAKKQKEKDAKAADVNGKPPPVIEPPVELKPEESSVSNGGSVTNGGSTRPLLTERPFTGVPIAESGGEDDLPPEAGKDELPGDVGGYDGEAPVNANGTHQAGDTAEPVEVVVTIPK
eukprot:jgi/Mesvir1/23194/Mv22658-RA.1